jgi:hypothetical protein
MRGMSLTFFVVYMFTTLGDTRLTIGDRLVAALIWGNTALSCKFNFGGEAASAI